MTTTVQLPMRRTISAATILALWAGLAPAPALAQSRESREHTQILADLRMVQEQQQRLQVAINQLVETLKTVTANQAAQQTETKNAFAAQRSQIDALAGALPQLRSQLEQMRIEVGRVGPELESLRNGMSVQLKMMQDVINLLTAATNPNSVPAGGGEPPPGSTATPPAQMVPTPTITSPKAYMDQAMGQYASGDYQSAIETYQEFLKLAPTSPEAPFAQRQIGEAYFKLNKLKEALAAYRVVTEKYKDSDQTPEAYYSLGATYEAMKDNANALKHYRLVSAAYPGTVAQVRADEAIKRLTKD